MQTKENYSDKVKREGKYWRKKEKTDIQIKEMGKKMQEKLKLEKYERNQSLPIKHTGAKVQFLFKNSIFMKTCQKTSLNFRA